MNADFYFETGSGKTLCQDYALAGEHRGISYAIGADGCSSSPDTDVGARLLCLTARSVCVPLWKDIKDSSIAPQVGMIASKLMIDRLRAVRGLFGIEPSVFDATLWVALWFPENDPVVIGWGDGVIIADYEDNLVISRHDYKTNAPLYLSYDMVQGRKKSYHDQFGKGKSIVAEWKTTRQTDNASVIYSESEGCWVRMIPQEGLKSLSVCSDGINTYMDKDNSPLNFIDVAKEFTAYKNTTGEFVKRRMRRVSKDCESDGTHHFDDVFCATIAR